MADRYRTILLFGAPGSGKGTQGKTLGTIPGFYHSATGDIFRTLDLKSEMGRKFSEFAGRGELVPDEFTIKLWKQYIKGVELINQFHPETEILVLDGLPRNGTQAKLLADTIEPPAPLIHVRRWPVCLSSRWTTYTPVYGSRLYWNPPPGDTSSLKKRYRPSGENVGSVAFCSQLRRSVSFRPLPPPVW